MTRVFTLWCAVPLAITLLHPQAPAAQTGAVSGRVVDQQSQPIPGATVQVVGGGGAVRTDVKGQFTFPSLPAGAVEVAASKLGYAWPSESTGPRPRPTVQVKAGQRTDGVVLQLWRAGIIEGVVDDDGDPVAFATVRAFRADASEFRNSASSTTAGADGSYRLTGLPPGDYLIAGFRSTGIGDLHYRDAAGAERIGAYAPVFYPAATDRAGAQSITVTYGDVKTGINLQLPLVPATHFDVVLSASDGRGLGFASARLTPQDSLVEYPNSMQFSQNGRFTFGSITAGTYVIVGRAKTPSSPNGIGPAPDSYWGQTRLTTDGTRPEAIALSLERGANLSGRIVLEGPSLANNQVPQVEIRLKNPDDPYAYIMDSFVTFRRAGESASWTGLPPGEFIFSLPYSPSGDLWIKSITVGARDRSDDALPLLARQDVTDLTITISPRASELSGRVTTAGGRAASASLVVWTVNPQHWLSPRRARFVQTQADGRYVIRGLAPGEYFLTVLPPGMTGTGPILQAGRLAPLQAAAVRVVVSEGQVTTKDLNVVR